MSRSFYRNLLLPPVLGPPEFATCSGRIAETSNPPGEDVERPRGSARGSSNSFRAEGLGAPAEWLASPKTSSGLLRVESPEFADQSDTADRIRMTLDSLVRERQELRHRGTDPAALEANRIALVYWQKELSRRLIETSVRKPT